MSDDPQIDELRSDIEQTRDDMSQTIDQLEEKLSPDHLQDEVLQMARQLSDQLLSEFQSKSDAMTERISEQMQSAIHGAATAKADELFSQATDTLRMVGNNVWTRLSENPAPIALAAAGIGMLVMGEHNSQQNGQGLFARGQEMLTDAVTNLEGGLFNATESAEGMAGQAGSALGDAVESVKAHAGQVTEHVSSHMPLLNNDKSGQSGGGMDMGGLAGGMLALGLGFMAGLSIPETERERAAMEPVRSMLHEQMDKLGLDEMRGDAADLMESVKQAGSEVVSSAKDTLSSARQ